MLQLGRAVPIAIMRRSRASLGSYNHRTHLQACPTRLWTHVHAVGMVGMHMVVLCSTLAAAAAAQRVFTPSASFIDGAAAARVFTPSASFIDGGVKQLFTDLSLFEAPPSPGLARIVINPLEKVNGAGGAPLVIPDAPWESATQVSTYSAVVEIDGVTRVHYGGVATPSIAEAVDGLSFAKPPLGKP